MFFNQAEMVNFQYFILCDPDFQPASFDVSNIILLMSYSVIIIVMARFGKIRSFEVKVKYDIKDESVNVTVIPP